MRELCKHLRFFEDCLLFLCCLPVRKIIWKQYAHTKVEALVAGGKTNEKKNADWLTRLHVGIHFHHTAAWMHLLYIPQNQIRVKLNQMMPDAGVCALLCLCVCQYYVRWLKRTMKTKTSKLNHFSFLFISFSGYSQHIFTSLLSCFLCVSFNFTIFFSPFLSNMNIIWMVPWLK